MASIRLHLGLGCDFNRTVMCPYKPSEQYIDAALASMLYVHTHIQIRLGLYIYILAISCFITDSFRPKENAAKATINTKRSTFIMIYIHHHTAYNI